MGEFISGFLGGWLKIMIGFIVLSLLVSICNNAIGIHDPVDLCKQRNA